ncbi:GSCOCG00004241001-RA-CDS [Cotesia congregata]|nr:GSCOCG00004241001-RA-CDS [Cotesia congregata]
MKIYHPLTTVQIKLWIDTFDSMISFISCFYIFEPFLLYIMRGNLKLIRTLYIEPYWRNKR